MKAPKKILIGVLAAIVLLVLAKNVIAKIAIENGVGLITGLPLKMGKFDFSLLKSSVEIKDMKIKNPSHFPNDVLLDMPEIYVDFNLGDMTKGKIHLEEIRIDLKEFVLVKNADGQLNINQIKAVQKGKQPAVEPAAKAKPAEKGAAPKIQIDSMQLKLGEALFKDYSGGKTEPTVTRFPININERYTNITNPNQLVSLIVVKVMMNTPLAALSNFDLGGLQNSVSGALGSSEKLAYEAIGQAADLANQADALAKAKVAEAQALLNQATSNLDLEGTTNALTGAAQDITGGLKGTASELRNKLKNPFSRQE